MRVRLSDDQFDEVMDIYEKVANPPQSPQLHWVDGGKFLRELETYVEDDCKGIAQAEMPDELTLDLQAPARLFSTAHARNYDRKELDRERYKTVKLQDFVAIDPPAGDVNEKPFWIGRVMKINRTAQTAQVKWWWSCDKDPYTCTYKPWTGVDNAAAEITPNNIIFHWPNLTPKGRRLGKGVATQIKRRLADRNSLPEDINGHFSDEEIDLEMEKCNRFVSRGKKNSDSKVIHDSSDSEFSSDLEESDPSEKGGGGRVAKRTKRS